MANKLIDNIFVAINHQSYALDIDATIIKWVLKKGKPIECLGSSKS